MGRLRERLRAVDWGRALVIGGASVVALLAIVYGAMSVYCFAAYGGKPVGEIPAWALWFMLGFGGR